MKKNEGGESPFAPNAHRHRAEKVLLIIQLT